MKKVKDGLRVFAFIVLILFSIVGVLFASLSVYEYIRYENGEKPASISYNFKNSTFMLIEQDISKQNTVEDMPNVSLGQKFLVVLMKITAYLLPFSLGGILVYFMFYYGRDEEREKIKKVPKLKKKKKN